MSNVEAWLRGPVPGYPAELLPVVHALIQASEDIERLVTTVPDDHVWERPGGAASIGFHVRHLGGALDRLCTYARGEALSDVQKAALRTEESPGDPPESLRQVADRTHAVIERVLAQLRATAPADLLQARTVGRAALPSTTLGLLFHAAEHSTRHAGQALTTARILGGGSR